MQSNKHSAGGGVIAFASCLRRRWPRAARTELVGPATRRRAGASTTGPAQETITTTSSGAIDVVAPFATRVALRGGAAKGFPIALALLSTLLVGLELFRPVYVTDPSARAALETVITLCALLSGYLLLTVFRHRRRLSDLLLLVALVILALVDFVFAAVPALSGVDAVGRGTSARLGCELLVSIAFAAAAFAPRTTLVRRAGPPVFIALGVATGIVVAAGLSALIVAEHWAPAGLDVASVADASYPVSVAIHVLSSGVLFASGIAFFVRPGPRDRNAGLLAGAAFLLSAATLQYLAMPAVAADWVTPGVAMRVAAYGFLLVVALQQDAKSRQEMRLAAINSERQRIARDLHDGLAQDLAVIAAHGPHLFSELGADHPLVIAARRTLAASRGAIVDLAASTAPSTGAALRQVADELEVRFGVRVSVQVIPEQSRAGGHDLDRVEREEVVRIAREAIVNAAQHGGARHVRVELNYRGPELLRVSDDGCGFQPSNTRSQGGFGLPTMRARAESIGGRLVARPRAGGGTELEVRILGRSEV